MPVIRPQGSGIRDDRAHRGLHRERPIRRQISPLRHQKPKGSKPKEPKGSSLDNYHFAVRRPPVSDGRLARAGGGAKKSRRSLRTGRCPPSPAPRVDAEGPRDVARHADDRRARERLALTGLA